MGGGRLELGIVQGNVVLKKKLSLLLALLSLMHANICMYIADIEMHMVERFLNSQTTIYLLSFSFSLFHSAPHHLIPTVAKSSQNLFSTILSDIYFPLLFKIY